MINEDEVKAVIADATKQAFDLGWNTALISVATAIDNMKVLGDTAASFAAFVREFKRDDTTQ